MKSFDLGRYVLLSFAGAMLAGCGGSQPPIGAPGTAPQSSISKPGHHQYDSKGPLLYVTNFIAWTVTVYHANARDPAPIATRLAGGSMRRLAIA
jgi:hypothetical protein